MKEIARNKRAYYDYEILEKFEAGISLIGQEVKSIKSGRINLAGSFVVLKDEEVFLIGATVPPYQPKNAPRDYNPQRSRKLLIKIPTWSTCCWIPFSKRPWKKPSPRGGVWLWQPLRPECPSPLWDRHWLTMTDIVMRDSRPICCRPRGIISVLIPMNG